MTLTLYIFPASFPARACMILTKVLGLDVKFVNVDLFKRDNLKEDFLKVFFCLSPSCIIERYFCF